MRGVSISLFGNALPSRVRTWLSNGAFFVQAALAAEAFFYAIKLAEPEDTFHSSPAYSWAAARITEDNCALMFLGFGVLASLGLVVRNNHIRCLSAFISSVMCGLIALNFWQSNPRGTGYGDYMIWTALSYWLLAYRVFVRG